MYWRSFKEMHLYYWPQKKIHDSTIRPQLSNEYYADHIVLSISQHYIISAVDFNPATWYNNVPIIFDLGL